MAFLLAEMSIEFYFLFIVLGIIVLMLLSIMGKFISLWFQAFVSGTPIALFNIIGMSLRKDPARLIVNARINAFKAGLKEYQRFGSGDPLSRRRPCNRSGDCPDCCR